MIRPTLSCWLLLIAFAAAGCGDGRNSAPVTGKVTVNGKPLADVGVTFEPQGTGAGRGSFGRTDADGRYTLQFVDSQQDGALVGKHLVTFSDLAASETEQSDAGNLPEKPLRIPAKYSGEGLEYEVAAAGADHADFDLK